MQVCVEQKRLMYTTACRRARRRRRPDVTRRRDPCRLSLRHCRQDPAKYRVGLTAFDSTTNRSNNKTDAAVYASVTRTSRRPTLHPLNRRMLIRATIHQFDVFCNPIAVLLLN